ncbi:MAG: cytochrome c [Rhodobacteraceae bacterium]|nr:cytochrome c [Paracoccaceae bacterium]
MQPLSDHCLAQLPATVAAVTKNIVRLRTKALVAALIGGAAFWFLTRPDYLDRSAAFDQPGDAVHGAQVFAIGGCASCHIAKDAKGDDRLRLGGGQEFATDFGTFVAPNISPDIETGIGAWTAYEFSNAVMRGIGQRGQHLYPAFPYSSYARMTVADALDLKAFMDTLPAVSQQNAGHDLPLPFQLRRGLGLWKLMFLNDDPVIDSLEERGRYLVEGPGHCAECHSPRNALGGIDTNRWLAGAPNPDGKGRIPNITPHNDGTEGWSIEDIAFYLETGFTPEYDTAGASMVEVIENLSQISGDDRLAIARYLKSIPALPDAPK